MKIILLQDVAKIGKKFEIKEIADGFALNFLLPKKLAKLATAQVIKDIEAEKKKYEETRKIAEEKLWQGIQKIKDAPLEIKARANAEGKLFAGIDASEIAEAIKTQTEVDVDAESLKLEKPIKEVGEYKIKIEIGEKKIDLVLKIVAEGKS